MVRKVLACVAVALSAGGVLALIPASSSSSALGVCLEITRYPVKIYVQGMPVLGDPNEAPLPKDCTYIGT